MKGSLLPMRINIALVKMYCPINLSNEVKKAPMVDTLDRGGGVLPYKRLMGMCRWMGSHFHDWIDYNGVTFLVELLEWGRTFLGFLG